MDAAHEFVSSGAASAGQARRQARLSLLCSLYPFLEDKGDAFQQAAEHLAGRLAAVEPFEVSLPHFEAFLRKKGSTVWLAPHSDPPQALQDLHAALLDAFPQCVAWHPAEFTRPHVECPLSPQV